MPEQITAVWQNGGFSAKFKFSSSIELLCKTEHLCFDFRHFAKPQNVMGKFKKRHNGMTQTREPRRCQYSPETRKSINGKRNGETAIIS